MICYLSNRRMYNERLAILFIVEIDFVEWVAVVFVVVGLIVVWG